MLTVRFARAPWGLLFLSSLFVGCAFGTRRIPLKHAHLESRPQPRRLVALPHVFDYHGFDLTVLTASVTRELEYMTYTPGPDQMWVVLKTKWYEREGRSRVAEWVGAAQILTRSGEVVKYHGSSESISANSRGHMSLKFALEAADFPVQVLFADGSALNWRFESAGSTSSLAAVRAIDGVEAPHPPEPRSSASFPYPFVAQGRKVTALAASSSMDAWWTHKGRKAPWFFLDVVFLRPNDYAGNFRDIARVVTRGGERLSPSNDAVIDIHRHLKLRLAFPLEDDDYPVRLVLADGVTPERSFEFSTVLGTPLVVPERDPRWPKRKTVSPVAAP